MNPTLITNFQNTFQFVTAQTIAQFSVYLPRIVGALLVFLIGTVIAKAFKRVVIKILETMRVSKAVKNTPIEHFVAHTEATQKIEVLLGSIVYWLIMLLVIHTTVTILGLDPVSRVLDKVLAYIPQVFSAILVLFFGTLLAGVVESVVKASIKSIDGHASRLLGKVSSYMVITISVMAAISELGIARDFIMILFQGFIAMIALGFGLAIGLGGKDVVGKMLTSWYDKTVTEIEEK
ncbi:MAG TPA: hypothetical protein VD999_00360 [Vitreimonas sp.]|nr:hypothetical protein [Vitreimonas sp.]